MTDEEKAINNGAKFLNLAQAICKNNISTQRQRYSHEYFRTVLGLYVKAFQTFQSLLLASQQGLVSGVQSLNRVLFETCVAHEYLSRNSICLREFNNDEKKKIDLFGCQMSKEFRCKLYVAHKDIENKSYLENSVGDTDLGISHEAVSEFYERINRHECAIGKKWFRRLEKKKTYSGISFRNVCYSLGGRFVSWYKAIYKIDCWTSHAADASLYVSWDSKEKVTRLHWQEDEPMTHLTIQASLIYAFILLRHIKQFDVSKKNKEEFLKLFNKLDGMS